MPKKLNKIRQLKELKIKYFKNAINNIDNYENIINNVVNVILSLKDHYDFNKFKTNNDVYLRKLSKIKKNDIVIKKNYLTEFEELIKSYESKNEIEFEKSIKFFIDTINENIFLRRTIGLIKEIFNKESFTDSNKKQLEKLVFTLYCLFKINDFPSSKIKELFENIWKDVKKYNNYYSSFYPHDIDSSKYDFKNELEVEKYNEEILTFFENLTVNDRIEHLYEECSKDKDLTYVFRIDGISSEEEFNIGKVKFVNKNYFNFFKNDDIHYKMVKNNIFDYMDSKYSMYAIISTDLYKEKLNKVKAINEIQKAFEYLHFFYSISNHNILKVLTDNSFIFSKKNKIESVSFGIEIKRYTEEYFKLYSLKITDNEIKQLETEYHKNIINLIFKDENCTEIEKILKKAFHWYKKSETTEKIEEKFTNLWIILESYFVETEKIKKIKEFVKHLEIKNYIREKIWENSKDIDNIFLYSKGNNNIPKYDFLKINDYENNGILDIIYSNKIEYLKKINKNKQYLENEIKEYLLNVSENLSLIYILRNKIVHSGNYYDPVINILKDILYKYVRSVIFETFEKYKNKNIKNINELKSLIKKEYNELITKLNDSKIDFYTIEL